MLMGQQRPKDICSGRTILILYLFFIQLGNSEFQLWNLKFQMEFNPKQAKACSTQKLFEREACYADGGIDIVPLRGDVFVTDLKIPLLAWEHGRCIRQKQPLFISEHYLIEGIVKFEGNLDLLDLAIARVLDSAEYKRHFLIQEICGAAHLRLEKMNLRCVGVFRRTHGQRFVFLGSGWDCVPANQQRHDHNADEKSDWKPAAFFRRNQAVRPPVSISVRPGAIF
jgi:hypothetical protein